MSGTVVAERQSLFAYLPVGLFGSVMGLTGLSVAWRLAHARYGVPEAISLGIAGLAVLAFVLVSLGYALKLVTAFSAVRSEFRHPIAGNLFGTFLISLLLLPILVAPFALRTAQIVWADRRHPHGAVRLADGEPLDERQATGGPCHAGLDHPGGRIAGCAARLCRHWGCRRCMG